MVVRMGCLWPGWAMKGSMDRQQTRWAIWFSMLNRQTCAILFVYFAKSCGVERFKLQCRYPPGPVTKVVLW